MISLGTVMISVFLLLLTCHVALSTNIVGGQDAIEPGDAYALEAAQFAVGELSKAATTETPLVMISLVKGTRQVKCF
jgi:hypothetical protein